ncbi:ribonuclease H-like domain-containing protein [Tanacetum coccineum]
MCDKNNSVLFSDTACIVLSPYFKLTDENHVLLNVPRKDNMYSVDLKNVVPQGGLTCLFAKTTPDESNLWHKRLGHAYMNQFCEKKGIKREFSVARTPQQNGAEAVNTDCYVQNRVLVIMPHNKTPYEIFLGRKPALSFMRLFGCLVTILNTIDHLGTKACDDADKARMETVLGKEYILLLVWPADLLFSKSSKDSPDAGSKPSGEEERKDTEDPENENSEASSIEESRVNQEKDASVNSTSTINTISLTVITAGIEDNVFDENIVNGCADDLNMPELEDIVYSDNDEDVGAEADINNLDAFMHVSPIPTPEFTRII